MGSAQITFVVCSEHRLRHLLLGGGGVVFCEACNGVFSYAAKGDMPSSLNRAGASPSQDDNSLGIPFREYFVRKKAELTQFEIRKQQLANASCIGAVENSLRYNYAENCARRQMLESAIEKFDGLLVPYRKAGSRIPPFVHILEFLVGGVTQKNSALLGFSSESVRSEHVPGPKVPAVRIRNIRQSQRQAGDFARKIIHLDTV